MQIFDINRKCLTYLNERNYFGFDLYDALTNRYLLQLGRNSTLLRRAFIQINARSPINLRSFGMQPLMHTKTITDLLWYYSISSETNKLEKISELFHSLVRLKNTNHDAWGLNFPFTSRFGSSNADTPNLYNTVHSGLAICNALPYLSTEEIKIAKKLLVGILDFLENILGYVDEGEKGWYLYYPTVLEPTYNVNALALHLLCYLKEYLPAKKDLIEERINKITELLTSEQNSDGSWYYTRNEKGKWIDGFHTAFIIESLAFAKHNGYNSRKLIDSLNKSVAFYINNMFTNDGFPLYYYKGGKYPIESQNCAQAIQTLSCLMLWDSQNFTELLEKVIKNTIVHLYSGKGYFYHKKGSLITYKNSYPRWSTTPMILGLEFAKLAMKLNSTEEKISSNMIK